MDDQRRVDLYEGEAADSLAAMTLWLRCPQVRQVAEAVAPSVVLLLAPLEAHLPDQVNVCHLALRAAGTAEGGSALVLPDGSTDAIQLSERWELDPDEVRDASIRVAILARIIERVAEALANDDVPIQAGGTADRYLLGELLLLHALGFVVPWDDDPKALATKLQPIGLSGWSPDGLVVRHRHRPQRGRQRADVLAADWSARTIGTPPATSYGHGSRRQIRSDTVARREALARVLDRFPDTQAGDICRRWRDGSSKRTPGGLLRELCDLELDECPSRSTVERDLKVVRAARREK